MTHIVKSQKDMVAEVAELPLPGLNTATPAFVILEDAMLHNLRVTAKAAGGIDRLMPHVKTHRAAWVCEWMVAHGVSAFKAATPLEVKMCLKAGAQHVLWAYPTANRANIRKVLYAAIEHPSAKVEVLYDSDEGLAAWVSELKEAPAGNVILVLDLDPGMGRTGAVIEGNAFDLAQKGDRLAQFGGCHLYDGHIQDIDLGIRQDKIRKNVERVEVLLEKLGLSGLCAGLTASGSWSFDIWPHNTAQFVSPGSFIYSNAQHAKEQPHLGWKIAAYVLASVVSTRSGSATLDAGYKSISPDMKLNERFLGPGEITAMSEEHAVIQTDALKVGQQVPLVPSHTCTTAYLFPEALVLRSNGVWETKPQLGNKR